MAQLNQMRLSLITTTYQRAHSLLRCALSVYAQRQAIYQWIIYIDDNDYHSYADIIKTIKDMMGDVVVVCGGRHVGRARALNEAHKVASGNYMALLDDDDWLHPEASLEVMKCDGSDIIYTDFYVTDGITTKLGLRNTEPYLWTRMAEYNIMFHLRVYTRDLYECVGGGHDVNLTHRIDYDITLKMLAFSPKITKINRALYYYSTHNNSITSRHKHLKGV